MTRVVLVWTNNVFLAYGMLSS